MWEVFSKALKFEIIAATKSIWKSVSNVIDVLVIIGAWKTVGAWENKCGLLFNKSLELNVFEKEGKSNTLLVKGWIKGIEEEKILLSSLLSSSLLLIISYCELSKL